MEEENYGYLRDFDWSVRMILSSDKLSGLGKPVVQVKLDTASTQDGSINAHLLEMDLKELNGLLKTLKSAQAEKEAGWYISPCVGIPTYAAEKDPHCPTGQIRKFNEEKKLKAQILAQRDKTTTSYIKSTLNRSIEYLTADINNELARIGRDSKSKVKTSESYVEIEILQKIVVRENLLAELQKLLKTQNDVSACLGEVVELVKAMRFQTLDIIEDIQEWQQSQPKSIGFQYKGFNYLVKIKGDLDFLDQYEEIIEKFCFEFRSNPLAYRGGGNVITGYGYDQRKKPYSQGLLRSYYSETDDEFLDGLEVSRLLAAEKVIQAEYNRIAKDKLAGREVAALQDTTQGDVLNRDIFNALGKSASSLPDMPGTSTAEEQEYEGEEDEGEGEDGPNSMDRAGFRVGNAGKKKGKKPRRGGAKKSTTVVNPKRAKQERIAALVEEASELKAMMVNVDEKLKFLTDHHHDLLNQRASLDTRLKEAKAMGREVAAQHISAEITVNAAIVTDNAAKMKDLQRESYFINLERKRKLGTAQKLKDEMEDAKRRAVLQKKIEAKIKKEGLLAALQSFSTKSSVEEIAALGDKALGARPSSAGVRASLSSPPRSAGKSLRRSKAGTEGSGTGAASTTSVASGVPRKAMSASASAPTINGHSGQWTQHDHDSSSSSEGTQQQGDVRNIQQSFSAKQSHFPTLMEEEEEEEEDEDDMSAGEQRQGYHTQPPTHTSSTATAPHAHYARNDSFEAAGNLEYNVQNEEGDGESEEEEGSEEDEEEEDGGEGEDEAHEPSHGPSEVHSGEAHSSSQPHLHGYPTQSPQRLIIPGYHPQPLHSPSDSSLDGAKLSPLSHSFNYSVDSDLDHAHHHDHITNAHTLSRSSSEHRDNNDHHPYPQHHRQQHSNPQPGDSVNEMYISDDEETHVDNHHHSLPHCAEGRNHNFLESQQHGSHADHMHYPEVNSPFSQFQDSPERHRPTNSGLKTMSDMSDLSVSPLSMHSPAAGVNRFADSFISGDSPLVESVHKSGIRPVQVGAGHISTSMSDPSKQLFTEPENTVTDFPAGGAYALVRSLKLSPRPDNSTGGTQ